VTIRAARRYAGRVTAVVSTADDGGSTGRLRSGMGIPAPGDLRRCLVAMAGAEDTPLGQAFEFRFGGTDLEGHALGNLMLAGLDAVTGDFLAATDEVAGLLGIDPDTGRVLPATVEPVRLCATTTSGESVVGQVAVKTTSQLARVRLHPPGVAPSPGLVEAVHHADQIVLGPGSLYTSVLAAAVVDDLRQALATAKAQRIYVCNLRAEAAETKGYDVADHVAALDAHGVEVDAVVVDPTAPLATSLGDEAGLAPDLVLAEVARPGAAVHDPEKLASVLAGLLP
jgi:uncharacterized cofD-like protein